MNIKTPYIWKNGTFIDWDDTQDHHLSHALHYGSWVFEWIRFYNTANGPKIFKLQEHIDRFFYSASVFQMDIPFSKEEIMQACIETVAKSWESEGYIRPIMYYGTWKMWLNPTWAKVETVISVWKFGKYLWEKAIDVKIPKTRRVDPRTTDMNAKICGNYSNSILVSLEIKKDGYDEGLLLDTNDYIAEGPGENIFFVQGNQVVTPELGTILPGITRATIIDLFKDKFGIEVEQRKISPDELGNFDEAFFVWTAAEVTPIASITNEAKEKFDYTSWNPDSISKKMSEFYHKVVIWKDSNYMQHLS